jgi:hypothetical protein
MCDARYHRSAVQHRLGPMVFDERVSAGRRGRVFHQKIADAESQH